MVAFAMAGFLLGFVLAATPGPMWSLAAQRTLTRGLWHGVVTGLLLIALALWSAFSAFRAAA